MELKEAASRYEPCSVCKPPVLTTSTLTTPVIATEAPRAARAVSAPTSRQCAAMTKQALAARGSSLGLLNEATASVQISDDISWQDLERDVPIQFGIPGAVDHTHPAPADLVANLIASQRSAIQRLHG
jgi:hypothetical protein